MKRTVHPLTSIHRQPGGLARLAYVRERFRSPSRVGIMGWQQGNYALPLADDGHRVTVIELDARVREEARKTAEECGFDIEFLPPEKRAFDEPSFDAAVVDVTTGGDALHQLTAIRPYLAPSARIFVAAETGKRFSNWGAFQSSLRKEGWRMRDAVATRVFASAEKQERPSSFRETVEDAFAAVLPFRWTSGWIAECGAFDISRPLVIHFMPTLGVGGAERLVLDLATKLPEEGFDVWVVGMLGGGDLETAFHERGIRTEIFRFHGPFAMPSVRSLLRLLKLSQPEIVHTHLFGADAWGRFLARLAGVPFVFSTEHNVNPSYGWVKRRVNRSLSRITTEIIAVTEAVKGVSVERDGIAAEKIRVIPNGIDMERVIPRGAHRFHDVPRLITTGRLHPQKDHATLLKALALVKRPWSLRIAGDGPLASDLRALADRLGIASRVEWLGVRHDIPHLLAESDLFCFPSRWEGLGNAVIEAAAAGVPVIASDLPPVRETLEASEAAFIAPGDVPAWAHAIRAVLTDPSVAVMSASRAVPRIRSAFALSRMVAEYAKLYRSFLSKNV